MSIYIKGMEMPRKTGIISIVLAGDGSALLCEDGTYSEIEVIPVPDHGDLIDRNELIKHDHQHYEYLSDEFYVTVRDIENAPTIIAADPVKEGNSNVE